MNRIKSPYLILFLFLCFTYSCSIQRMIHFGEKTKRKRYHIYGLVKNNNDWIEFIGSPAQLSNGVITGYVLGKDGQPVPVSVPEKEVKKL